MSSADVEDKCHVSFAMKFIIMPKTSYLGFDALRTPNRFDFAIGLEIGPYRLLG